MNKKTIILVTSIVLLNGCSVLVTDSMLKSAYQDIDKNHDGYINYHEYLKTGTQEETTQEAKKRGMSIEEYSHWDYNRADTNQDNKISLQEFMDLAHREL